MKKIFKKKRKKINQELIIIYNKSVIHTSLDKV